eukprot:gene1215-4426_t
MTSNEVEESAEAYFERHCIPELLSQAVLAASTAMVMKETPALHALNNALNSTTNHDMIVSGNCNDLFEYYVLVRSPRSRERFIDLTTAMAREIRSIYPSMTGIDYLHLLRLACPRYDDIYLLVTVQSDVASWECYLDGDDFNAVFKAWQRTCISGTTITTSFVEFALARYYNAPPFEPYVDSVAFREALNGQENISTFSDAMLQLGRHMIL